MGAGGASGCVFCRVVAGAEPASVVLRDGACTAFLDLYPAAPGHLLVVPDAHAERLADLAPETSARLLAAAAELLAALRAAGLAADGANLLLNDGPAANQSVPHVHVHVVPRRRGDTLRVLGTFALRAAGLSGRPAPRSVLDERAARVRAALPPGAAGALRP